MAKLEKPIHKESKESHEAHADLAKWGRPADKKIVEKTILALKANGIDARLVLSREEAKKLALSMISPGAEVMTMTSETLRLSGIADEINDSGRFQTARSAFASGKLSESQKRKLGAAPDYALGSVHAITQDGRLLIASATGSQLPAYAYGAGKVIWVVGTQKIVKDIDEAMNRLEKHTFPLENERAKKAYGMGSFISKVLMVNKEFQQGRLFVIFIDEAIGF